MKDHHSQIRVMFCYFSQWEWRYTRSWSWRLL